MTKFEILDELPKEIENRMTEDLVKYELDHGIDVNYKRFSLVLYDDEGVALGVINAFTAFAEIYIDDMWVDSRHRKNGYGKCLIEELERSFEGRGFNNINLCTNAFNAPEFYKKCGFQLEFVRKNLKNPRFDKFFFSKMFRNEDQYQGIVVSKL